MTSTGLPKPLTHKTRKGHKTRAVPALDTLTLPQLRAEAKAHGVSPVGTKGQIIARLLGVAS